VWIGRFRLTCEQSQTIKSKTQSSGIIPKTEVPEREGNPIFEKWKCEVTSKKEVDNMRNRDFVAVVNEVSIAEEENY